MKKAILYMVWVLMFILCAALGFLSEPAGFGKVLMVGLAVLFFLPPGLLLWEGWRTKDRKNLRLLCLISLSSLAVTLALMVANLLSVLASDAVGTVLYYALVILGTPMMCSQYWFLGPVLWAAVLFTGLELSKQLKEAQKA